MTAILSRKNLISADLIMMISHERPFLITETFFQLAATELVRMTIFSAVYDKKMIYFTNTHRVLL